MLPGKLQRAGQDVHPNLAIVDFGPWRTCFIPETQIQGEDVRNTPVVLHETGKEPVALMPSASAGASSYVLRKSERPIRSRVAATDAVSRIISAGTETEEHHAQVRRHYRYRRR